MLLKFRRNLFKIKNIRYIDGDLKNITITIHIIVVQVGRPPPDPCDAPDPDSDAPLVSTQLLATSCLAVYSPNSRAYSSAINTS